MMEHLQRHGDAEEDLLARFFLCVLRLLVSQPYTETPRKTF